MVDVVIVDDDLLVSRALRRELVSLGLRVKPVADPNEVERVLSQTRPGMIICDLRMPTRSGVHVLAAIKQAYPDIKRCLLSGSLSELRAEDLELINPCVLLSKPWRHEDLVALLSLQTTGPDGVPLA